MQAHFWQHWEYCAVLRPATRTAPKPCATASWRPSCSCCWRRWSWAGFGPSCTASTWSRTPAASCRSSRGRHRPERAHPPRQVWLRAVFSEFLILSLRQLFLMWIYHLFLLRFLYCFLFLPFVYSINVAKNFTNTHSQNLYHWYCHNISLITLDMI